MKKTLGFIILLFICIYPSVCYAVADIFGGGDTALGKDDPDCKTQGCVVDWKAFGLRVTIYSETGKKVSDSVDIMLSKAYEGIRDYEVYTTIGNKTIDKIGYIKNNYYIESWNKKNLKDIVLEVSKPEITKVNYTMAPTYYEQWVKHYADHKEDIKDVLLNNANLCQNKYNCGSSEKYFAVFEPTVEVWGRGQRLYGSVSELAKFLMNDSCTGGKNGTSGTSQASCWKVDETKFSSTALDRLIRMQLPFRLTISGKDPNTTFYENIKLTNYCLNPGEGCEFSENRGTYFKRLGTKDILYKGVGIAVYDWSEFVSTVISPTKTSCEVDVDINECGVSNINEATTKACISDNKVYSYLDSCNLYCADTITTDFSGIYNTFVGNNKLNAIKSGKYQSIKGNPTITITKTCYQGSGSRTAECGNVAQAFEGKVKEDYITNEIKLNVDGNSYTLLGSPTFYFNGYSSATITYEYKLDDNVNKYINIETMKGADLTEENKNKVIINGTPMIITSKASYGVYNYNLDVSNTALNKYISSGTVVRNFNNDVNNKGGIENKLTITYKGVDGNSKVSYANDDLNYSCSYIKYNTDKGCVCPENTICDPVTCNPVIGPCECDSEYGCLDDGMCTSLKAPATGNKVCNPEKEVCMPNVIYRPISLTNPFPGLKGEGRTPGTNWNRLLRDKDGNLVYYNGSVVGVSDYYITNNRGYNDYEIYQSKPLYTIYLDADTINYIRDYNDAVRKQPLSGDYNDFDFTCEKGEKCISNFLRGNSSISGYNRNLLDLQRSECYRDDSFETCIKRKGA